MPLTATVSPKRLVQLTSSISPGPRTGDYDSGCIARSRATRRRVRCNWMIAIETSEMAITMKEIAVVTVPSA
jgi:hypothetical protein